MHKLFLGILAAAILIILASMWILSSSPDGVPTCLWVVLGLVVVSAGICAANSGMLGKDIQKVTEDVDDFQN